MADYDSILKEEKKYEEPVVVEEGPKPFPWFRIDLILLTLILIISYVIYYNVILTPKNIFLNDLKVLSDRYLFVFEPLRPTFINDEYNLKGTISLNEKDYDIILNKDKDITNFNLTLAENSLNYYYNSNKNYLNVSDFNKEYYQMPNDNLEQVISNLKEYFQNKITDDKFTKKAYIYSIFPIVESNLTLEDEEINSILGLNSSSDYKVLFTFKNNAITNKIISMKMVVNNLTTNKRAVIFYENNYLIYKDDDNNLKYELEQENKDFNLKIYKEDIIYSILTGTSTNNNYQYSYQVIDQVYNITLDINSDDSTKVVNYKLSSSIEKDEKLNERTLEVSLEENNDYEQSNINMDTALDYNDLTEEEKNRYHTSLDNLIGELRQFIKEY